MQLHQVSLRALSDRRALVTLRLESAVSDRDAATRPQRPTDGQSDPSGAPRVPRLSQKTIQIAKSTIGPVTSVPLPSSTT